MLPFNIDGCARQGHLMACHYKLSPQHHLASPTLLLNADFPAPCSIIWQALDIPDANFPVPCSISHTCTVSCNISAVALLICKVVRTHSKNSHKTSTWTDITSHAYSSELHHQGTRKAGLVCNNVPTATIKTTHPCTSGPMQISKKDHYDFECMRKILT